MLGLQIGVPLVASVVAALLYIRGTRRGMRPVGGSGRAARDQRRRRALLFALALVTVVAALASPIDDWADSLFWVHMSQHLLLTMVAAPLLVLSAPWMTMWRAFPLGFRRTVARGAVSSRPVAPLRALLRPWPAFIAFNVTMWAWHAPALYDLTLRNQAVHDLEHTMFLVTGVLLWVQLIDSPPLHTSLGDIQQGALAFTTILSGWFLALVLAFWPTPLYSAYASLTHRPGGISALTDQQWAAGMMWMIGSLPLSVMLFFIIGRIASDDERPVGRPRRGSAKVAHRYRKGVLNAK
ncbi:MAG: cytochrome c oxidase assembly protein [Gaiellales bacterium]